MRVNKSSGKWNCGGRTERQEQRMQLLLTCIVERGRKSGRNDRQMRAIGQTQLEAQEQRSPDGKICSPANKELIDPGLGRRREARPARIVGGD